MNACEVLKVGLQMADFVSQAYLADLSDAELLQRPHPQCNHINWQVGHIILSEHQMLEQCFPGKMPALPAGFEQQYARDAGGSDDPARFATKEVLLRTYREQRDATLAVIDSLSDGDLERETGIHYAPTLASLLSIQGSHWLMHCGQWVVVRRALGKPVVI
jgi:hypothetical protein